MTILTKLHSLLTGSPAPVPALASRVFIVTAAQRSDRPYLTMEITSELPILTHDGYEGSRVWRVTLNFFGPDREATDTIRRAVDGILIGYTDGGAPGIQRCMPLDLRSGWEEQDRLFRIVRDLDIMEDLEQ